MSQQEGQTDELDLEILDQEAQEIEEKPGLDDKDRSIVKKIRKELARRRIEDRQLREANAKAQADLEAAQTKLVELESSSATYETELVQTKETLDQYNEVLAEINTNQIGQLPEAIQEIVPESFGELEKLQWITKASPVLSRRTSPAIGEGAGSKPNRSDTSVVLDADEMAMAANLGLTADEYAEFKE